MRKFIIKNRQKRKYTRKNQTQNPFYLYKSFAVSLLPILLIITAAFSMFLLIQNNSFISQKSNFQLSLPSSPNISFSPVINYSQSIKNFTFQAAIKTFHTTARNTQNIYNSSTIISRSLDPGPLISITIYIKRLALTEVAKTTSFIIQQVIIAAGNIVSSFIYIVNFLISLFGNIITNLYKIIINAALAITAIINTITINSVNTASRLIPKIINTLANILTAIYKIIYLITHSLKNILVNILVTIVNTTNLLVAKSIHAITNILSSIYKVIPPIIQSIKTVIISFLSTINYILQLTQIKITHFLSQLVNIVKSPIIELNNETRPLFSYLNKSTQIVKRSINNLSTNFNALFKLISSRTKSSANQSLQINYGKL